MSILSANDQPEKDADLADRPTIRVPAFEDREAAKLKTAEVASITAHANQPVKDTTADELDYTEQETSKMTSIVAAAVSEPAEPEPAHELDYAEQETAAMPPVVVATADEPAEIESIAELDASAQKIASSETEAEIAREVEIARNSIEAEEVTVRPSSAKTRKTPARVRRSGGRPRKPRKRWSRKRHIITWTLLFLILSAIVIPAGFLVNFAMSAYATYNNLSAEAHSAVSHVLNVEKIFTDGSGQFHLSSALDVSKLQAAQKEFVASGQDFQRLQSLLQHSSTLKTVVNYFPSYRTTLSSAQAASTVGIDIAHIGQLVTASGIQLAPTLGGPLLAASGKPLITQSLLNTIDRTITQVLPFLKDIQANARNISLNALPISAKEKTQIGPLLQELPVVIKDLGEVQGVLGAIGWVLGVDQPRTFLVQTMDETELRGTGGFTGQYGELTINGGRVAPLTLKDISQVEYVNGSANQGQLAPEQYQSWWPFANWGLRDSNISADFPTTAQLAINLYKEEVGNQVDGVISFTPVVIEHILTVTGPIYMPIYKVTVNAQNLEDVLHYYQLDNAGITQQYFNQSGDNSTSVRKRFTSTLASMLMQKVRSSSLSELLSIARLAVADLKSRDLQIYFANSAAEAALAQYGSTGQMDLSTTHDGLYIVQENLSASKASQYVQTSMHDTVALDSSGGATHVLQLRLVYNQAGPVYGYDTYYDYVRVYVPPNSQLISGDGFATGDPLCGGAYGNCPVDGVYPGGELTCPAGQYQPGSPPPTLTYPDGYTWQPLQTIGGPTNTVSDEPGRAMYGGWVIVPKNCTMNVTLSWYVPPLSHQPYTLLVQRQAGTFPELDLTILPDAANCTQLHTSGLHFDNILTKDASFIVPNDNSTSANGQSCYPEPPA